MNYLSNFSPLLITLCMLFNPANAASLPRNFTAQSVNDGDQIQIGENSKKGLVVVFLSALCPCSHSHIIELKQLTHDFPEFEFVGVHSNTDETKDITIKYFRAAELTFPVIQDFGAKLADQFKAYKTPHAFVLFNDGRVAYQGGVSSSQHFDMNTKRKYLREALEDISADRKVKTPEARTLGCVISRKGENVW